MIRQVGSFLLFSALLFSENHTPWALTTTVVLLICWVYPPGRWLAMVLGTCYLAGKSRLLVQVGNDYPVADVVSVLQKFPSLRIGAFVLCAGLCLAYRETLRRLPVAHFGRRHGFSVYFTFVFLLASFCASVGLPQAWEAAVWSAIYFLAMLSPYVFYEVEAIGTTEKYTGWRRLLFMRPFWQVLFLSPIPRGAAELTKTEVSAEERADLRLNATRLMVWGTLLRLLFLAIRFLVFDDLGSQNEISPNLELFRIGLPHLPALREIVRDPTQLNSVSSGDLWFVLVADFVSHFLQIAWRGAVIVAVARMAGFRLLRNTYRPLESKSLAEFFGRYNFYYKELLWRAFFFPSFRQFFRKNTKARMTLAVFLSVGLGNFLFLLGRDILLFAGLGVGGTLVYYAPYAVYCIVLSFAIAGSMLLSLRNSKERPRWRRVLAVGSYIVFFSLLRIFDDPFFGDIHKNFAVFLHLFGLVPPQ